MSYLDVWDYVIMAGMLVLSLLIGIYFRFSGGHQKTNEEYLHADRKLKSLPVAVSLMASIMSAITLLGVSAENYYNGMVFVVINISYILATPVITKLYLPVFFGLQKTSTYEYLELRFGSHLRTLVSLTYILQMMLYNGIVLYAPATVLEAVVGMEKNISILLVGLACTLYSSLGGIKAVVFTDVFQSLLMFTALFSVIIFSSVHVGGIKNIFDIAAEGGRLNFFNFSLDLTERHTWWSLIIGGFITYLSLYAVNHTQVQRLLTLGSLEKSQRSVWISLVVTSLLSIATCTSGLAMYAVYRQCDPLKNNFISKSSQLMAYFAVDKMKVVPGLLGLFMAGIFSATLSTISAGCNSLAAVIVADYINRWCKLEESVVPWITKLAACGAGLICVGLAFTAERIGAGGLLQAALTIFGAVGGPLLAVFTLGVFTTVANERGASIGLVSGLCVTLWLGLGGPRPAPTPLPLSIAGCGNLTLPQSTVTFDKHYFYLYRISYMWISPIGFVWSMCVGGLVSALWRQRQPWQRAGAVHPDPALFAPPIARLLRNRIQLDTPMAALKAL